MPVVPDDEEEVVDPYVDDRSDSATNDGDDDDGEDDVPVMSDEEEVDEWWAAGSLGGQGVGINRGLQRPLVLSEASQTKARELATRGECPCAIRGLGQRRE